MVKHVTTGREDRHKANICVLEERRQKSTKERVLDEYDATPIIGLRTVVRGAAIERASDGDVTIELPKLPELLAAAAVSRCLMPIRLRGWEIKAIRKIMRLTLAEMAKKLDERTAVETVSRWETESQPIGGYAEKVLRLLVCEQLRKEAPGVTYRGLMIAELKVIDPWLTNKDYELPYMPIALVRLKEQSGSIIDAWEMKKAA
jgi:DNA-binding transcriptional regulator YiaG